MTLNDTLKNQTLTNTLAKKELGENKSSVLLLTCFDKTDAKANKKSLEVSPRVLKKQLVGSDSACQREFDVLDADPDKQRLQVLFN